MYKFGQLPYEYKPRGKCPPKVESIEQGPPASLNQAKQESQAYRSLTSLTPPPEIGFQFPSLLPRNFPPVCSCYVDYRIGTACPMKTFPASPIIFPHSCGYAFNMFNHAPPSPPRAIPVPVITSTHS